MSHFRKTEIYLVDGGDRLLAPMSEKSQKYTLESLKQLGVEVKLNMHVVDYDGNVVTFKENIDLTTAVKAFMQSTTNI